MDFKILVAKVKTKISVSKNKRLSPEGFSEKHPECSKKIKEYDELLNEINEATQKSCDVLRESLFGGVKNKYVHYREIFLHPDDAATADSGMAKVFEIYSSKLRNITNPEDGQCLSYFKTEEQWQKICSEGYSFKEEKELINLVKDAGKSFKNPSKKIRQIIQDDEFKHIQGPHWYENVIEFFDLNALSQENLKLIESWKKKKEHT